MGFFNIGEKDEYGQQKRIEHRGRYLRASRTGGVSLRAQTRVAGVNLTANSQHGFRVSRRVTKNTQVALQNGRFVLRGRYGKGPLKLNLSKSGLSLSSRNALGTFNWTKPNYSSAKIMGVQVRGKKAANLQMLYMLVMAAVVVLQLAVMVLTTVLTVAFTALAWLGQLLWRVWLATPYQLERARRAWRNRRLQKAWQHWQYASGAAKQYWPEPTLLAALLLLMTGVGRGRSLAEALPILRAQLQAQQQAGTLPLLVPALPKLDQAATRLAQWQPPANTPDTLLVQLAALAEHAAARWPETLPECLLELDELMLNEGPRTVLQDTLLAVFTDFAGLRMVEAEQRPDMEQ